jgi:hypothetical protein
LPKESTVDEQIKSSPNEEPTTSVEIIATSNSNSSDTQPVPPTNDSDWRPSGIVVPEPDFREPYWYEQYTEPLYERYRDMVVVVDHSGEIFRTHVPIESKRQAFWFAMSEALFKI